MPQKSPKRSVKIKIQVNFFSLSGVRTERVKFKLACLFGTISWTFYIDRWFRLPQSHGRGVSDLNSWIFELVWGQSWTGYCRQITAQEIKFSIQDLFSKCDQIRRKLQIWSHLLKKSVMENFIFCAVDLQSYVK